MIGGLVEFVLLMSGVLGENVCIVLCVIFNWVGFGENVLFMSGDIGIFGVLIVWVVLFICDCKVCRVLGVGMKFVGGVGFFLWFVLFWVGEVVGSVEGDGVWNGGVFVWVFIKIEFIIMLILFWIIKVLWYNLFIVFYWIDYF